MTKFLLLPLSVSFIVLLSCFVLPEALNENGNVKRGLPLVRRHERKSLVKTDYGEVTAANISDGTRGPYHLQFITLEPLALFLPVLLHADMMFFVHTGSGRLTWTDVDEDNKVRKVNMKAGDIYRLYPGSVFYIESNLEPDRRKLRIYAIFSNTDENIYEATIGAYSSITDLVLGFDRRVLQSAMKVPEVVLESIRNATRPPAIVHALPKSKSNIREWESQFLQQFLGSGGRFSDPANRQKKTKTYNIFKHDPDFENCNGWSLTVDKRETHLLKGSNYGIFYVNLTKASMMGPHWNPMGTEISVVLHGQGVIRVVCSSSSNESECKNMRFWVKEGDAFAVPKFHPMAQMSFNNDSFVFMGFSTTTVKNYPQFLAGKSSFLQTLDRRILAASFNVSNTTIDQLLAPQMESVILECTSCAEEELRMMEEEHRRRQVEEERERRARQDEQREREIREEERRQEEAAMREQEEARKQAEERRRQAIKEEERERHQQEKQEKRQQLEEQRRKQQEEVAEKEQEEARRQAEERRRRAREEEERERQQQEKQKRRQQQEEQQREWQEKAAAREQEEARRQAEERRTRAIEEERECHKKCRNINRESQQQEKTQQQEEKQRRRREEAAAREQQEARRQVEERIRRAREEETERQPQEKQGVSMQQEEQRKGEEAAEREQEEARGLAEERERRARQEQGSSEAGGQQRAQPKNQMLQEQPKRKMMVRSASEYS